MTLPLASIVITSYNRGPWIGQAIESAMAQDYPNLEIIISDNCSTDNSDEVIKSYCHDPRIRYSKNETNIGLIPNFQKAFFELARGVYITHVSSDDYLTNPAFITNAIRIINDHENISIVFGIQNFYNELTRDFSPNPLPGKYDMVYKKGQDVFFDFASNPYYSCGGALYSMDHLKKNHIYFTGRITADIEINLQMMLCGDIGFINEVVYMIRQHDNNASSAFGNVRDLEDMYLAVYKPIYEKALPVVKNKDLLDRWYRKLIFRNMKFCLHVVLLKRNRKWLSLLNRLLLAKYRKHYFFFLMTHPKFIARMILNR